MRGVGARGGAALALALLLVGGSAAFESGSWTGGRNIENIRPDEAAAPEFAPPAGGGAKPGVAAVPREGSPSERDEAADFAAQLYRLWDAIPAYSPVNAKSRLTSRFGWRTGPLSGRREFHGGIDLAAAPGTPVVASADGVVEASFFDKASGRVLVLEHGNGIETVYGHLAVVLVAAGQEVRRGTPIGQVGSTGWRTTGPHLHYGIRVARKYVDPGRYVFRKPGR